MALFYSIVFDVFGARNYRATFSVVLLGFGISAVIGGLSSAYSFSSDSVSIKNSQSAGALASSWFYAMAGGSLLGLVLLRILRPIDFNVILKRRLQAHGLISTDDDNNITDAPEQGH